VYDNFFVLGGHSLLAIQMIAQVNKTFQVELTLRSMFEATTVADQAQAIIAKEARPGQSEKIAQILQKIGGMSAEDVQKSLQHKGKRS
jgi:surfactin family lipopeptide synthetase C